MIDLEEILASMAPDGRALAAALAGCSLVVLAAALGRSPCHEEHISIEYRASRVVMVGRTAVSRPASCYEARVCDVRCAEIDRGRQEAHEPHPVIVREDRYRIDERCEVGPTFLPRVRRAR